MGAGTEFLSFTAYFNHCFTLRICYPSDLLPFGLMICYNTQITYSFSRKRRRKEPMPQAPQISAMPLFRTLCMTYRVSMTTDLNHIYMKSAEQLVVYKHEQMWNEVDGCLSRDHPKVQVRPSIDNKLHPILTHFHFDNLCPQKKTLIKTHYLWCKLPTDYCSCNSCSCCCCCCYCCSY